MKIIEKLNDEAFWENIELSRFAIMAFTVTFGTCLSSIAVLYTFKMHQDNYLIPLAILTCLAMASNTVAIAQSLIKWVVGLFALNVLGSTLFLIHIILM